VASYLRSPEYQKITNNKRIKNEEASKPRGYEKAQFYIIEIIEIGVASSNKNNKEERIKE
jgi:hypothetical protein